MKAEPSRTRMGSLLNPLLPPRMRRGSGPSDIMLRSISPVQTSIIAEPSRNRSPKQAPSPINSLLEPVQTDGKTRSTNFPPWQRRSLDHPLRTSVPLTHSQTMPPVMGETWHPGEEHLDSPRLPALIPTPAPTSMYSRWFGFFPLLSRDASGLRSTQSRHQNEPEMAEIPQPRRGEVICLEYQTLDDDAMYRLEGRSDHRPVIGTYAIYV